MRCPNANRFESGKWFFLLGMALASWSCGTEDPKKVEPTPAADVADDDTDAAIGDIGSDAAADAIPNDTDAGAPDTAPTGCATDDECKSLTEAALCVVGTCNLATGLCEAAKAADDTACDDGKLCTAGDKCKDGSCTTGVDGSGCTAPNVCKKGRCSDDGTGACELINVGADLKVACDDGNACTDIDLCANGACTSNTPKDCDDQNACTEDSCSGEKGCLYVPKTGVPCDDGNACTSGDICDTVGLCTGPTPVVCDDGNFCTQDTCDSAVKGCKYAAVNTGSACNPNNVCLIASGKCSQGKCESGPNPLIDDADGCTFDECDSKTGKIKHTSTPGGACDDGDDCTKGDLCGEAGQCTGSNLICNDGNPCTSDKCDPLKCTGAGADEVCGQCVFPGVPDGAACTDSNLCTTADSCQAGTCKGITAQCDDKNDCTNDGCQPGGGCTHGAKEGFCSDGDPCTTVDKCASGKCAGTAKDCKDTNSCTKDSCNAATGACNHDVFVGPCDDGNACTTNDLCQDSVCDGAKLDCDDGNPCTLDTCDTLVGCKHPFAGGGTPCDDGFSCTGGDVCSAGKCIAAQDNCSACNTDTECKTFDNNDFCDGVVKCLPGHATKGKVCSIDTKSVVKCDVSKDLECAKNTCNPDTGTCAVVLKNEGLPCSATDKCIDNGTCQKDGSCAGVKTVCNDQNPCTTDSCDKVKGCIYAALADATSCDDKNLCTPTSSCKTGQCVGAENTCACKNDSECDKYDDGDKCNGVQKCLPDPQKAGTTVCQSAPNSAVTCAKSTVACQTNVCATATGLCGAKADGDGALCNDSNLCTVGETCAGGVCSSTKKVDCNDNQTCTVDVCDKVFGCANAPVAPGGLCNDGDACTKTDNCDVKGVCAGVKVSCDDGNACTIDLCDKVKGCTSLLEDGSACQDGNPCTNKDACKNGICSGDAIACDDQNSCTVDACDGAGGCKNVLIEGKDCTDGNACTIADACVSGKCVGKVKVCDDGNGCTEDVCKGGACVITPSLGKVCDDGNACSSGDLCDVQGVCGGKLLDCTTGTVCLSNLSCSPVTGCVNVPNDGKTCSDNDACTTNDTCAGGGCQGLALNCDDKNVCTTDACDPKLGCQISQNACDDKNPCTIDTCDKIKDCQHEVVEGAACDDGNKCHEKGQCLDGACKTADVKCDDKNGCTLDSCDAKTGCVFAPGDPTLVTCDDANPCTVDTCDASGACKGAALNCDDGNPCTVDSCDPLKGCVTTDAKENEPCDDGAACSTKTVCQGGVCSGGTITCVECATSDSQCAIVDNNNKCDGTFVCELDKTLNKKLCISKPDPVVCDTSADTACSKDLCNPATGKCEVTEALNGAACEDGKGCTVQDTCMNGACVSGQPNECASAKDACNDAKCVEDPSSKPAFTCVQLPKTASEACDADSTGCTANDFCALGKCVKGTAVDCTGVAKACESATCKSTGANSFQCAVAMAVDGTACDDGQLCTDGDACKTGKCVAGTKPHDCSDIASICATGFCDKTGNGGTGACLPQAQNEGSACDADQNGCTTGDKCISGACLPGQPPDCGFQATACTTGACKSTNAGTFQCLAAPKAEKLPCEADNNGCTVGDACIAGKCTAGSSKDCSGLTSQDGCLVGTCKSLGASQSFCETAPAPLGQSCNSDDNGCTKGDTCNKDGACSPGPTVDCLAFGGTCATGICKSTGTATFFCDGTPKPDGQACDADLDGCTVGDKCLSGKCMAGAAADCATSPGTNACVVSKCVSGGSDKFQCDPASLKDGTACNNDSNGCTVDDSCKLGSCTNGEKQTCSAFAGLCGDAACQSTGTNAYKCNVTPKESYPPLSPPVACAPSDNPSKCTAGYECVSGACAPKASVACSDSNPCTLNDVCAGGQCTSGPVKDCDDKDPCTLDACKAGVCAHTAIAGCVACIDESFEKATTGWLATSDDAAFVNWAASDKNPLAGTGNLRATWKGPPASLASPADASYRYRRLYVEATAAPQLDFNVAALVGDQACGKDDFYVTVNGIKVFELCTTTEAGKLMPGTKYQHVTVDMAPYAGSHVDLELHVLAGIKAENTGTVDIDDLRLTGACGPACLGVNFELTGEPPAGLSVTEAHLPQTVRVTTSNEAYAAWVAVDGSAHSLKSDMTASYTGTPPNGEAVVATLTVPGLRPVLGDKLWFAVKTTKIGDTGCTGDDLVVTLGGKQIYKRCDNTGSWKTESFDLAAYENQTVDLVFTVTSGTGSASAGTFEIDDIAIAGKCTYACFRENFDTLSGWALSSNDATNFKTWAAVTANPLPPTSPPKVAFASYDTALTPAIKDTAMISAKSSRAVVMPVLGATYGYNANVFAATANCATGPLVYLRMLVNQTPATQPSGLVKNLAGVDADGNFTFASQCKSTSGWTDGPFLGEIDAKLWGRTVQPSLVAVRAVGNAQLKASIDDLTVMCR